MKSQCPDVLYSFPHPFDRYPLRVAKELDVPFIIEMWEDYAQFGAVSLKAMGLPDPSIVSHTNRAYRWMADIAGGADSVIVPTAAFLKRLCELGIERSKIRVVPVCVPPSSKSDCGYMRRKHNMKPDEKMVFHVGSASPWHDLATLFRSLRYIKSKILVVISGGIPDLSIPIQDFQNVRVTFTGRVTPAELNGYLSAADICVAPYHFHRPSGFFPAKVIRYMLAGKAIVVTDLLEIREMFKGKSAGILVPQRNPRAFGEAIEHLAKNDEKRSRMGTIAKEIAETSYLTRHHTDHLMKLFKEIS